MKIILLRGLLRERRHWEQVPQLIRQQYPDVEVLTPDLAGNGARYLEESPTTVTAMVSDLRAELLLTEQREAEPIILVAISMGGMIATQWAKEYPDEVAGLVLINTSFKRFSRLGQRFNPKWRGPLIRFLLAPHTPYEKEQLILELTSNHRAEDEELLARWTRYAQESIQPSRNLLRQLWAAGNYKGESHAPLDNVLLLASSLDQLVNVECSKAITLHWNCPLALHPTAGHDLSIDAPNWLVEQLADVIEKAQAPAEV